ncbi:pyocin activator PrtN family protein [Pseudomonas sp. JS3066]|uniref:pyocin activator PrtN family protein n=1 Tax=Pseudomonas sp. JS3066 TaxID=3090665 RepID=UPI002E7AB2FD|nr:pyocin activator PrtN family protein [Pseudomonas sp. JS3066]WVK93815.1 pyocin activator PrtN family protein [Pseudomonas sp. JS3066]
MSQQQEAQQRLHLPSQPRQTTVELLFRMFGTVLIPAEDVRTKLFRNLNQDRFGRVLGRHGIPMPVTQLHDSNKAPAYVEIHRLAAYIEHRATLADEHLTRLLNTSEAPETEAQED